MKLMPVAALALAVPAFAQPRAPVRPLRIDLTMTHGGFVPNQVSIRSGAPYTLRITNRDGTGHNLTQEVFFREARVDPADRDLVPDGKIVLGAGQRVAVHFQAPLNRPGATYQFSSTVLRDAASDYKGGFVIR